jgi:hypothetical protein
VQRGGRRSADPPYSKCHILTIEDRVWFWHVQMSTSRYESACGFCIQPLTEEQISVLEARQLNSVRIRMLRLLHYGGDSMVGHSKPIQFFVRQS